MLCLENKWYHIISSMSVQIIISHYIETAFDGRVNISVVCMAPRTDVFFIVCRMQKLKIFFIYFVNKDLFYDFRIDQLYQYT